MKKKSIKCIYKITDKRTGKVIYIGQTKDFDRRKSAHFASNKTLIDSFMYEQGRENFEMNIILDCSNKTDNEINCLETQLITEYDTINTGFNKNIKWPLLNKKLKAKIKNATYYKENKDKILIRNKNYQRENKDKILIKNKNSKNKQKEITAQIINNFMNRFLTIY